tara:strand:- start:1405 stop:1905 length:501 start_codon:yes stop_codon:yes gene_type:complete
MSSLRNRHSASTILLIFASHLAWADDTESIFDNQNTISIQSESRLETNSEKILNDLLKKALVESASNNLDKAEAIYLDMISKYPKQAEIYNNLASLYWLKGEHEKAFALLRAGIFTHPTYKVLLQNLTRGYAELAAQSWRSALSGKGSKESTITFEIIDQISTTSR